MSGNGNGSFKKRTLIQRLLHLPKQPSDPKQEFERFFGRDPGERTKSDPKDEGIGR